MSYYLKSGETYRVTSKEQMDLHETLPGGNYTISVTPAGELFLVKIEDFEIRGKLYGDVKKQTDRILHTFLDRRGSTGILLAGEKGSGKTLLAKHTCVEAALKDIPTIVINAPWKGDAFSRFLQSIEQPCIVLFDEFEKVYDQAAQQGLLTLLDGVFPTQKLFMLTTNNKYGIDYHMRNRPGRIYYMMEFRGLTNEFIKEYCQDNLNDKSHILAIERLSLAFDVFNFDMLKALIEEMNRFGETPQQSLELLNTRPEFSNAMDYTIKVFIGDKEVPEHQLHDGAWKGNPMIQEVQVRYSVMTIGAEAKLMAIAEGETSEEYDAEPTPRRKICTLKVSPTDMQKIDNKQGKFVYKAKTGETVLLSRPEVKSYANYYGMLALED